MTRFAFFFCALAFPLFLPKGWAFTSQLLPASLSNLVSRFWSGRLLLPSSTSFTSPATELRALLGPSDAVVAPPPSSLDWMRFNAPTENETVSVTAIKSQLPGEYALTDITVLRFLRARKHNVAEAEAELARHMAWRRENVADTLRVDTSSFTAEHSKRKCINEGFDRLGRPLVTMIARRHDKNDRDLPEVCKLIVHTLETAVHRSRARLNDEKIVIVFDMSGFTTAVMDYDAVKVLVSVLLKNYPDVLAAALIVNAPMLFSACWAVIKPWLDPVTAAKCVFVKPAQLADYIDPAELPEDVQLQKQ